MRSARQSTVVDILPPIGDPLPPSPYAILVGDRNKARLPHVFYPGVWPEVPVCDGAALSWVPFNSYSLVLSVWGGNPRGPTDESVTALLSRDGLRKLIADLQSIEQQMEGM